MRCLRLTALAGLAIGMIVCASVSVQADDKTDNKSNADKIVGSWQLSKVPNRPLPEGLVVIAKFDKDGKVTIKSSFMGKSNSLAGTYKVDGKKMTIKMEGQKEDTATIKTLDDKKLVTVSAKGEESEFKKADK